MNMYIFFHKNKNETKKEEIMWATQSLLIHCWLQL